MSSILLHPFSRIFRSTPKYSSHSSLSFWIYGIIGSTIIFLLPTFCIKTPEKKKNNHHLPYAPVNIVNMNPTKREPILNSIIDWMVVQDPTIIFLPPEVGPNREHPFRNWVDRDNEYIPFYQPYHGYPIMIQTVPIVETRISIHTLLNLSPIKMLRILNPILQLPINSSSFPTPKIQDHSDIVWANEQGKILSEIPPVSLKEFNISQIQVNRPSIYQIIVKSSNIQVSGSSPTLSLLPEIRLEASCGDLNLDQIGYQKLLDFFLRPSNLKTQEGNSQEIRVYLLWHMHPAAQIPIEFVLNQDSSLVPKQKR